jgi:hypothetical protein
LNARKNQPNSASKSHVSGSRRHPFRGRSKRAAKAGLRVSELTAENTVDDRRRRDGDGELAEEPPGNPPEKGAGHEHRAENQRHGDHRSGDFFHGAIGGLARTQAAVHPPLDVFHHDDGVIDDDADRQDQPEERDVVEAEADGGHHGKGADDGHRQGRQGNQHRPPIL